MRTIGGVLAGMIAIGGAGTAAQPALALTPLPIPMTPDGPATMSSVWRGASTTEGRPPEVLQAVTITVGPGGSAGHVRLRASDASFAANGGVAIGDWFTLPAEPGTYTFPAPRIRMDYRSVVLALDQQTGGHAIVRQEACTPELGRFADRCALVSLDAWAPILPDGATGAPPELQPGATPPTAREPGRRLQISPVSEIDRDGDLAGDRTEDRTDLAVRADAVRGRAGRLTIAVTNDGPRTADWPVVAIDRPGPDVWMPARGWTPECVAAHDGRFAPLLTPAGTFCSLPPLAPGASHTVSLPSIVDGRPVVVTAAAEGPDLDPGDNTVSVVPRAAAAPKATLRAPARARASRGVRLRLRSETAATATVRLSVRFRGKPRDATRTLALRPGAPRAVTVRPPRVRGTFATGRARLTVTVTAPDRATRTLARDVRLVR